MGYNYINVETQNIFDYLSDIISNERKRYIYKPVSSEMLDLINDKVKGSINSLEKLNRINPIFSKAIFEEMYSQDRNIVFMKMDSQKYCNIGIAMVSRTLRGEDKPDYIEMYLSKKTDDGIILWRNLKDTPGFKEVYSNGNTAKIQRQLITSGASKDNKGSEIVDTNAFEITTVLRSFFKASETKGSKEYKVIQEMLNNEFGKISSRSFFQKSDSWFSKMNGLVSGHLENNLFTRSQVKDGDILKTKTSMGEQYVLKRKMNIEVFENAMSGFKRDSTRNRSNFFREFRSRLKEALDKRETILEEIKSGEKKFDPTTLNYLRNEMKLITLDEFKDNLNITSKLLENIKEMKNKNKKTITSKEIKKILGNYNDYLNKTQDIENALRDKFNKFVEYNKENFKGKFYKEPNYSEFNFKLEDVESIIGNINKRYSEVEKDLLKEMSKRIEGKVDSVFDSYYYKRLKNIHKAPEEEQIKAMEYVREDIVRNFFDKYNEQYDLFEIMRTNRQTSKISELDIMAEMVKFSYDKNGKITDAKVRESYNTELNPLSSDNKLRYGYYKARNSIGKKAFDSKDLDERLKLAKKFLEDQKELVEKNSEKSFLSKYDTLDDFNRAQKELSGKAKYESLAADIVSRTGDKIISSINYLTNELEVSGSMKLGDNYFKLKFNFGRNDGFNKNDWIKELESDRQAAFKLMDLETQKFIERLSPIYQKNYILQRLLTEAQRGLENDNEFKKLQLFKSFLKGQNAKNGNFAIYDMTLNGETKTIFSPVELIPKGIKYKTIKDYNKVYDNITYYLRQNYSNKIGYLLSSATRNKINPEDMESLTKITSDILADKNILSRLNNTAFMAVINRDQIINTSGSGKQSSLAHGDSYLTSFGYTLPGMAWNKVTQRTFQSQDLLGERSINIKGEDISLSELNTKILSRLGMSGVGIRSGKYTTEEMLKHSINRLNINNDIRNSTYLRGETYKTFAIGDTNTNIGDGLNSFSVSFQEGMTATRSMQLTTNAIRNKEFKINLEEIDIDNLTIDNKKFSTKAELHHFMKDKDNLNKLLKEILEKDLYETIEGREKFSRVMQYMTSDETLNKLDGSVKELASYYNTFIDRTNKEILDSNLKLKQEILNLSENDSNKRKVIMKIQNIMSGLNKNLGAMALPTTKKGKTIITNDLVKTRNELKPELGFSISGYRYNEQTHNIEIMLENFASSDQGSKGQASGAKFTISEIYDFMKVKTKNGKEIWIDAAFNNKAEKRTQTGMMIHGLLQTAFLNVYEANGKKGVESLTKNMSTLLEDLGVDVILTNEGYEIDESYLTKGFRPNKNKNGSYDFSNMNKMSAEEFESAMKDPLSNTNKMFTERGKEILDRVTKKYGASYYNAEGELITGAQAHTGVMRAIHAAYSKTFKNDIGENKLIPLTAREAELIGYQGKKEYSFGNGDIYLFKLASERVNSNSSKKKESALKVSREMVEMLRTSGYGKLSNYIQNKNTKKLTDYMGGLYASMTNSELLNTIYQHNKDFDITKVNTAISNTMQNGVLLDLSSLTNDDYLLQDKDIYLKHSSLMNNSNLGRAMKQKGLEEIDDNGKLINEVNVIINDDRINYFTKRIKHSMKKTLEYIEKNDDKKFSSYDYKNAKASIDAFSKMTDISHLSRYEADNLINSIDKTIKVLKDKNYGDNEKILDMNITNKMLSIYKKNLIRKNDFALKQLQTIFNTGNLITTVSLSYDVNEIDDTIVPNEEFNRIKQIVKGYSEIKSFDASSSNLLDKIYKNDKTIIDDIYNDLKEYYKGNKEFIDIKTSFDLVSNLNVDSKLDPLLNKMKEVSQDKNLLDIEKDEVNKTLNRMYEYMDIDKKELERRVSVWESEVAEREKTINKTKDEIYKQMEDSSISNVIKKNIDNFIFNKGKLQDKKTFVNFYTNKLQEQYNTEFDLLETYIKIPDSSKRIFKKEGKLTSLQKFKIDSSFVANPLEGSNLLNKFEELMFQTQVKTKKGFRTENVTNANQITENLKELQQFLGSAVINENLFNDLDGNNTLKELQNTSPNNFNEGLKKARQAFNRNIAEISEVTITSKDFTKSFRGKDHNWEDIFGNVDMNKDGFVRELSFLSRHPQQTYNHMGGIMSITIDTKHKNLNKFAYAATTYLPKEKNQAGIITLGKKTMLYRRGD